VSLFFDCSTRQGVDGEEGDDGSGEKRSAKTREEIKFEAPFIRARP
jgi:hypothetical protein